MQSKLVWGVIMVLLLMVPFQGTANQARSIVRTTDLSHASGKIGTFRALIIGIQNYNDPKISDLETPLNDARAMSDILKTKYGFKVKTLLDAKATRKAMYNALRKISSVAKPEDSVLIYYAGHGDFDRQYDDGWWIPVDARGGEPVTYLDNVQVQKAMRSMKARHVLLVSDSCYSGTLFGQARAMPTVITDKYYLNLYNEKSRWGMTSGNKTPVSDSGTAGHSVFAYQLIKKLKQNEKPYISTQEIYTGIAPIVGNNSEQTPLCRPIKNTGDQGGEFIFVTIAGKESFLPTPQKTARVPEPQNQDTSFDDILKAGREQEKIKGRWQAWQKARTREYNQVKEIDTADYLNAGQKKEAWQRFALAVFQNNPYSTRDDAMRTHAESRISYWNTRDLEKSNTVASITPSSQEPQAEIAKYQRTIPWNGSRTIKLGSMSPLTGPYSSDGNDIKNGVLAAIKAFEAAGGIDGVDKIQLLPQDTACDPRQAVAAANKLVTLNVAGVIGAYCSSSTIPASDVLAEEDIIMITPASTHEKVTSRSLPYMFRMCGRDDDQAPAAVKFIRESLGAKTIFIVDDKTTYSRGVADGVKKAAVAMGMEVLKHVHVNQGDKDFSALLTMAKKANADVFYMSLVGVSSGSMMTLQAKRLGMDSQIVTNDAMFQSRFIDVAKSAAEGVFLTYGFTDTATQAYKAFEEIYVPKYGAVAAYAVYAYDAATALLTALKAAGTIDPRKVKAQLLKLDYQGASKRVKFDRTGESGPSYITFKVANGKFVPYWSPEKGILR